MKLSPHKIHVIAGRAWLTLVLVLLTGGGMSALRAAPLESVDGGVIGKLSKKEFVQRYLPQNVSTNRARAINFLKGHTHSEAIEAAIAAITAAQTYGAIILDSQDWIIDRAILLPSNTELVIDGCKLKLADGVFDNLIRVAGIKPNPKDPNGACVSVEPVKNIKIIGLNGAIIEGANNPYTAPNPQTGVTEKWIGDYFGWRTIGILLSATECYEISGLTLQKTHCWAISQDSGCRYGYLHDLSFHSDVKNGDGIDFRNGCAFSLVENISGSTSDDTVACTALDTTVATANSKYIWPMQSMGYPKKGDPDTDIHDIAIRNITTTGKHHGIICLATSPKVYNISIDNVSEDSPSVREACVKIYTGYGNGYQPGNLRNISVSNVLSRGAKYAVMVKADVKDVSFDHIKQARKDGEVKSFTGNSENLRITNFE